MGYKAINVSERLKMRIRGYKLTDLMKTEMLCFFMEELHKGIGGEVCLTERHGEIIYATSGYETFKPDVVGEPGIRVRFFDRTMGHLYLKDSVKQEEALTLQIVDAIATLCENSFRAKEYEIYSHELENRLADESRKSDEGEKKDSLTGLLNQAYFESRMRVIDRSGVAPVAIIQGNVNDCMYVCKQYGEEESDRLLTLIAKVIKECAKPEYVMGRCDDDVFNIVIPMPIENEAEDFVSKVRERLERVQDDVLYPSMAFGIAYKENVEETISDKLSQAEYDMLVNKLEIKESPEYRARMHKGEK